MEEEIKSYLDDCKEYNFSDELIKFGIIFINDEIENISLNNLYHLYFTATNDPKFDEFSDFLISGIYYPINIMLRIVSVDLPINNDPEKEIKIKLFLLMKMNGADVDFSTYEIAESYYAPIDDVSNRNVILDNNIEFFDHIFIFNLISKYFEIKFNFKIFRN